MKRLVKMVPRRPGNGSLDGNETGVVFGGSTGMDHGWFPSSRVKWNIEYRCPKASECAWISIRDCWESWEGRKDAVKEGGPAVGTKA